MTCSISCCCCCLPPGPDYLAAASSVQSYKSCNSASGMPDKNALGLALWARRIRPRTRWPPTSLDSIRLASKKLCAAAPCMSDKNPFETGHAGLAGAHCPQDGRLNSPHTALKESCAVAVGMSDKNALGLGTLGWQEPVARKMAAEAGFTRFEVCCPHLPSCKLQIHCLFCITLGMLGIAVHSSLPAEDRRRALLRFI